MGDRIEDNKFVELTYKVLDKKSGEVLVGVEFPIGYVHGANEILAPPVMKELEGKTKGDIIRVDIDGNQLFGPRDETLVFSDALENVPEEYREIGTTIITQNERGEERSFIVTRMDDKTLTVDGNNPLCGRWIIFELEVLSVREASEEEIEAGGAIPVEPDIDKSHMVPI